MIKSIDELSAEELEELKELQYLPKEYWGDGPWQDEPDERDFEESGYSCSMRRSFTTGVWLGYVHVLKTHSYFPLLKEEHCCLKGPISALDVHGGITYAAEDAIADRGTIGFDCGHSGDFLPYQEAAEIYMEKFHLKGTRALNERKKEAERIFKAHNIFPRPVYYRTMQFAEAETRKLARQLKEKE